jgi:hypothetical protein
MNRPVFWNLPLPLSADSIFKAVEFTHYSAAPPFINRGFRGVVDGTAPLVFFRNKMLVTYNTKGRSPAVRHLLGAAWSPALEALLVRYGAPVLLGKKPAALFAGPPHWDREPLPAGPIRFLGLARPGNSPQVFMYRPSLLKKALESPLARGALESLGYPVSDGLEALLAFLGRRFRESPENSPMKSVFFLATRPWTCWVLYATGGPDVSSAASGRSTTMLKRPPPCSRNTPAAGGGLALSWMVDFLRQFYFYKISDGKDAYKFTGFPAGWKNPGPPPRILSTFRFHETGPLLLVSPLFSPFSHRELPYAIGIAVFSPAPLDQWSPNGV